MSNTVHLIAAARPNFMKIAPLYHALAASDVAEPVIVHTGQHYDINMSDAFFEDLRLPAPHIHLGAATGSHAEQTGNTMIAYEKVLLEKKPDMVVVVGDVNSTIACTLAAVKLNYPQPNANGRSRPVVAHLEAGLRSFDRSMPEEVNRLATDALADILWTPSPDGDEHLKNEGVADEKVIRVGNIMIDSLEFMRERIEATDMAGQLGVSDSEYAVATLHRPANVDTAESLRALCDLLIETSRSLKVVFPIHPRTRKNLESFGFLEEMEQTANIITRPPLSYIEFMSLVFSAKIIITDSGGIQEESSYLGIPCLTLRPNTERPITITQGTNQLCTLSDLPGKLAEVLNAPAADEPPVIDLWDGHTADRVVESIRTLLHANPQ